jgi:large subunit ribosomal protein L24
MFIKKGTQIKVICGKDKGKNGEVIEILKSKNMVKVKGINLVKKHQKTTKEKKGGIISKENYIHISNLKNIDKERKTKSK